MPHPLVHVTTHIHTDGPIPGPHSLLTLVSAAHRGSAPRRPLSTFSVNVRELPGATVHPGALQTWRRHPEDWLASRRASRAPAAAMNAYLRWVDGLPGQPTLITDYALPDHLFIYWYYMRFAGRWPFATVIVDADLRCQLSEPFCSLKGCRTVAA
jgi:hypothetical protein